MDAPYVGEFPFALECKLLHQLEIGLHTQFVGEIMDIQAEESVLDSEGRPDIALVRPFLFAPGNRAYYGVGEFLAEAFSVGKKLSR